MALAEFSDNFRVSNGEDWRATLSVTQGASLIPPWAGLPAWTRNTVYNSSSAVTFGADLYVARPRVPAVSWTSAITFGADIDEDGLSRWILVGEAAGWVAEPLDLTGADLTFAIWPSDSAGNLIGDYPALTAVTATGEAPILNAVGGGYGLAIPRERVLGIAPGFYRYDFTAAFPDGSTARIRYGLWIVDQGVA